MLADPKLRSQVDSLWDKFWTDGLANPLDAIEQFLYLPHTVPQVLCKAYESFGQTCGTMDYERPSRRFFSGDRIFPHKPSGRF